MDPESKRPTAFGFLAVGLLLGTCTHLAFCDWSALSSGYDWWHPYYFADTVTLTILGGVVGLAIGWVVDGQLLDPKRRANLLWKLWLGLLVAFVLYMALRTKGVRE